MSFEISDIKKIAHLSSLAISDEQANELAGDFSKILTLVEKNEREQYRRRPTLLSTPLRHHATHAY